MITFLCLMFLFGSKSEPRAHKNHTEVLKTISRMTYAVRARSKEDEELAEQIKNWVGAPATARATEKLVELEQRYMITQVSPPGMTARALKPATKTQIALIEDLVEKLLQVKYFPLKMRASQGGYFELYSSLLNETLDRSVGTTSIDIQWFVKTVTIANVKLSEIAAKVGQRQRRSKGAPVRSPKDTTTCPIELLLRQVIIHLYAQHEDLTPHFLEATEPDEGTPKVLEIIAEKITLLNEDSKQLDEFRKEMFTRRRSYDAINTARRFLITQLLVTDVGSRYYFGPELIKKKFKDLENFEFATFKSTRTHK